MTMPAMSSAYENPDDPWETITTPWGDMPAWKASTIASGRMGAYDTLMQQIRADAATAQAAISKADTHADALDGREEELNRREKELDAKITLFNDAVSRFA